MAFQLVNFNLIIVDIYAKIKKLIRRVTALESSGGSGGNGIYGGSDEIPLYTRATVLPDEDYLQPEFSIGAIPEWDSDEGDYLYGDNQSFSWLTISPNTEEVLALRKTYSFPASEVPLVWNTISEVKVGDSSIEINTVENSSSQEDGERLESSALFNIDPNGGTGVETILTSKYTANDGEFSRSILTLEGGVQDELRGLYLGYEQDFSAFPVESALRGGVAYMGIDVTYGANSSSMTVQSNRVLIRTPSGRKMSVNEAGVDFGSADFGTAHGIRWGEGDPNTVVTATPGSIYMNTLGGAGVTFWVKESGVGTNTGWIAK